jgi:hypothetical protein
MPDYKSMPPQEIKSMWEVEFSFNYLDSMTKAGQPRISAAGVAFLNNEFWVSEWNSDTIAVFNRDGQFKKIFTLPSTFSSFSGGIRSFSLNGKFLYATNNSSRIFRIDTASKAVYSISLSSAVTNRVGNIRFASYDGLLNNGAGGYWVGGFSSDIVPITKYGSLDTTMNALDAQLLYTADSRYGVAVDRSSLPNPLLWVFHQVSPDTMQTGSYISPFYADDATPFSVARDVNQDFNLFAQPPYNPVAGGIFISDTYTSGKRILCGIVQGFRLFGYELNLTNTGIAPAADAIAARLAPNPSSGVFSLQATFSTAEKNTIQVMDMQGNVLYVEENEATSAIHRTFDLGLAAGVYIVRISSPTVVSCLKLLMQ